MYVSNSPLQMYPKSLYMKLAITNVPPNLRTSHSVFTQGIIIKAILNKTVCDAWILVAKDNQEMRGQFALQVCGTFTIYQGQKLPKYILLEVKQK